ncbi:MAG TPA: SH3 domain-containing protein, partial [Clostridiales bacterium]|nr:SH3 domain-containing protein [Clostridiales bacterium]
TSYSVIGSVIKGDSVVVLETLNGWYKIRFGSETGYISSNYVSIEPTEPEPEEPEEPEQPEPETPEPETPEPETLAVVTGSVVNVRSGAGTSYSVVGSVRKGESVVVLETLSGWYKIRLKSGQTGYISAEYATIQPATPDPETKTGLVTGSYVNIRIGPSTSTQSLGTVPRGSQVEILGKENGWYLVRLSDLTGYISENYIAAGAAAYKPPAYIIKAPSTNTVGRISDLSKTHNVSASGAVVNFAKTMIGIPYVYGGASPETGFDCSGLTQYVYNALGYELPRISQYNAGRAVAKNELLPGDLVFFGPNGTINHVGIYIGNNQFIHAPNSGRPVSIDSLNSVYYLTNYVRATRILS